MSRIINSHHLLNDNQYYHTETKKERIIIHHTAGGNAESSIAWWNKKPDHISTPYLIDRDGRILEVFPPEYWAYALGVNSMWEERKSIQIELCNYGWLTEYQGNYYRIGNKMMPMNEVTTYKEKHRGYYHYEKYTDAQIDSLIYLIDYLSTKFGICIKGSDVEKFWWFDRNSKKKLISHTTVRRDKSDIHPQPNLIKSIYDYAGCMAPVTE